MRLLLLSVVLALVALAVSANDGTRVHASGGSGTITTVAGGWVGDGGPATSALLVHPNGVALDAAGSLYVADSDDCRIRKVNAGTITTVAGNGSCGFGGDGGPSTNAALNHPESLAFDAAGNFYIA